MSSKIDDAINNTIGKEGRYSNHPSDPGGETMWGITKDVARANGYYGAMKDMPRKTAFDIYAAEYFIKPQFHKVLEINETIAEELFDTGVNQGSKVPCFYLQRALNALNVKGTMYPDLRVDGSIGPVTLKSLKTYLSVRGADGIAVLLKMLNVLQGMRYIEIAERKETSEDFIFGWFRTRVEI